MKPAPASPSGRASARDSAYFAPRAQGAHVVKNSIMGGMDQTERERVRRFHQNATLLGALLMVAGGLAGAYIIFFRQSREVPAFLTALARLLAGK